MLTVKAEGFELVKLKNLWTADRYKGINSQWRRPDTGTRFEMQFHTPESPGGQGVDASGPRENSRIGHVACRAP
jgi:hypothetical protein